MIARSRVSAVAALVCMHGCTSSKDGTPSQPVEVTSVAPGDGSIDVPVATQISLSFSAPVNASTVTAIAGDGACSGSVQVSADAFAQCVGGNVAAQSATTFALALTSAL